jgi:hypothetical protein
MQIALKIVIVAYFNVSKHWLGIIEEDHDR